MSQEFNHGGGHINTPDPERPSARRAPRPRLDTPDPVHAPAAPTSPAPEPAIWQVRQRVNPYYMGRERLLQQLHDDLQRHPICHLHGVSGSGTSQTALAYAYRARGGFNAVFWLDGKDALLFRFGLARHSDDLDLTNQGELGQQARVAALLEWMATHDRWLLIADGVVNTHVLDFLLPHCHRGRILLTGHVPLDHSSIHVVEQPPLEAPAASRFLEHRSSQPGAPGLDDLVERFAGITLPLYLAGAFCHTTSVPLETYEKNLTLEPENNALASQVGEIPTVQLAVGQSLRYLSDTCPPALELMALCAYLDSESIPLVALFDGSPFLPKRLSACVTQPQELDRTLSLLFHLGLLQFEQNSISVHYQIQEATRRLLGDAQGAAWLMTALRVVLEAFPIESEYTQPIPACSLLVPHALAVTRLSEKSDRLRENTGALLNHVGLYLHACEELEDAESCFRRAIAVAEALYGSSAHPTVAARLNSLGVVLQDQKRYEEARDCYQKAFDLCEAIYGPSRDAAMGPAHRSMLTMPSRNLCQVLRVMGDTAAAKAAYKDAIDTFMEVYCWNHSLVAKSMSELGELWHLDGDLVRAQQCFLKAIQAEENAEEQETGAVAHYTRNLAHCLLESENFEEARKFYEHALYCDREDFGPVHERVASDLQGLAKAHRARSRFDMAHACLDEVLTIRDSLAEGASAAKALVWRQKGRCYLDAHDYDDAVRCFEQAITIREEATGPSSAGLGPDFIYLGRGLGRMEMREEESEALLNALALHDAEPWLDEDELSALLGRLVRTFREQKSFARAAEYQKQVLDNHQVQLGNEDTRVAADAYGLGNLYVGTGDLEEADTYLQMAFDIYLKTRGPEDERTLRVSKKLDTVRSLSAQRIT